MALFLINLAGAVALLIWAVRLIRTGVERAFLAPLRSLLRRATASWVSAAGAGAAAAIVLQSSTAVAVLTAAFAGTGSLSGSAGVALILGADVGSAVVAQILLAPLQGLMPLLLVIGVTLFLKSADRRPRQAGRILVGLALILLALTLIREAAEPLRHNALVGTVLRYLASDLISSFILGAAITYVMHSSVAAVLMLVTFAAQGMLPGPGAGALVLGANLGGALIPFLLTLKSDVPTRRIMAANLMLRGGGAVVALLVLRLWPEGLGWLGADHGRQAINLHLVFNLAVLVMSLPLLPAVVRATVALFPDPAAGADAPRFTALDEGALADPRQAIGNAQREVLRMGEEVQSMLLPVLGLFRRWDEAAVQRILASEDEVDRMHFETKLYVARLQEAPLTPEQSRRAMEIASFANNFEEAGDQISTNLLDLARKMNDSGLAFSDAGWNELTDFHDRVLSNGQLALNVMISNDLEGARQLVEEKDRARAAEQRLQEQHLARLRSGNSASIETSNLHQEMLRALKSVNTAFCQVAYPLVEQAGDLLSTRLTKAAERA
ncbi:Na+/Pi-cotransporter [Defluviimonas sp. 20V17]|uniref:Na+/cotransporter n=1 Tax=Allgaiera indica TaxID=765699 RepID=A0AAN4UQC7_9RHOB|nr:Na/Pi cotransporter family protein [Allgaiera indica]KDB03070.1 Na+/Pi-cotransporter [Defluviimonas sp. 20V17]GHE00835.1 Na+/cotransporter [Allgaiera indica]SDW72808.1 phosphate:Na+ symporter [Allgaiera indica]